MALNLPSWLQISPQSGAPLFLTGFSEGQNAAARNLERDRQDQLAAQHAQDVAAETELQKERIASTLASDLIDRQVKAQTAARQLQGMQKYQSLVAGGMDPSQALIHSAPDMFYQHPEAMTTAMYHQTQQKSLDLNRAEQREQAKRNEEIRRQNQASLDAQRQALIDEKEHKKTVQDHTVGFWSEWDGTSNPKDVLKKYPFANDDMGVKNAMQQWHIDTRSSKRLSNTQEHQMRQELFRLQQTDPRTTDEQERLDELTNSLSSLAKIKVRRKSDGAEFFYSGAKKDVPTDKYDIVE